MIKIDYDGSYPSLCGGDLFVTIDGDRWEFPRGCLRSGGSTWIDEQSDEHTKTGNWKITKWPEGFPKQYKQPTLKAVNKVIPHGCCGGCI